MALTPQQISAFDQVSGLKTDPGAAVSDPASSSWADQIRALASKASASALATPPAPPAPQTFAGINQGKDSVPAQITKNIGDTFNKGAQNLIETGKNVYKETEQTPGVGMGEKILDYAKGAGNIAGTVAGTTGGLISSLISPFLPKGYQNNMSDDITSLDQQLKGVLNKNFTPEHAAAIHQSIGDVINAVALQGGKTAEEGTPGLVDKYVQKVGGAASDAVDSVTGKISDTASTLTKNIKTAITSSPKADIITTPEDQVYKLSPLERKAWYEAQKTQITDKANASAEQTKQQLQKVDAGKTQMDQQIMQQHQTNADALTKQAEDLQRQLATTARDKVVELRPKILSAMQKQSQTYRSLIEEGMAGKEGTIVDKGELKDFVDSRFGDDPNRAAAIKDRLGLTETVDPMSTRKVDIAMRQPKMTLGDIYEQTKNLKQEKGVAATKGTRVFTSDEKLTDDAINTLSSYMKGQGVDLSQANQFWSKYAPIRNQLVTEAKPFLQTGTNTKTFANTLMRVAKGTDVNNENFINEVENMLGEPITKEVKNVVAKLNTNEKQALANQIDTELSKVKNVEQTKRLKQPLEESQVENKKTTGEAQQRLSDKKFNIEQKASDRARIKGIITKILVTLGGGIIGGEAVKNF